MKAERKRGASAVGVGSYPLWLWHRLRGGGARRIWRLMSRTLLLRRIALWIVRILVLLESGVLLVLLLALAAILLPPLILLTLTGLLLTTALRRRAAALLRPMLDGRRVLLLDGFGRGEDAIFLASVLDLAGRGYTVLLVGYPTGRRLSRQVGEGAWAIAPSLYFTLRARRFYAPARLISVSG